MDSDFERCKIIVKAVESILSTTTENGITNEQKICMLSSVLQNQSAGQSGAGLTGGQQQESLWVDMLTSGEFGFSKENDIRIGDADYYYNNYPISHKTIGWNGTGDLALAWSKNPVQGLQRTEFKASMAIALTRRPSRGKWESINNGYYVVPLSYLKENITFSSNNKTDSLIKSDQVITAIKFAATNGLMIPLQYNHEWGKGKYLSYWNTGLSAITLLE